VFGERRACSMRRIGWFRRAPPRARRCSGKTPIWRPARWVNPARTAETQTGADPPAPSCVMILTIIDTTPAN
jgi:hypothetical protein